MGCSQAYVVRLRVIQYLRATGPHGYVVCDPMTYDAGHSTATKDHLKQWL